MRHLPIDPALFVGNRARLVSLLPPNSLVVVNANDIPPTNSDGSLPLVANSDLFYLSGVEQENSILLIAPHAFDENLREVLFVRETNDEVKVWEGHKLTKDQAKSLTGIKTIKWLGEFPRVFRQLMLEAEQVFMNSNEHGRAVIEVESRDARFVRETQARYPLHGYRRLAPLMHQLRLVKSPEEVRLLREAVDITRTGFERVCGMVRPGAWEHEIEAEFIHEFTRRRAKFAYTPIIAAGVNSNVLHYIGNDQQCKDGDVLLLDVAASYANYNADLTRTLPVNGRFTSRQRQVYDAVLRVLRACIKSATLGKLHRDWQKESKMMMNEELLSLGLITKDDINKQTPEEPACKKYFNHGLGHPLGLDVHDVGLLSRPFAPGWVLTVEPGVYIPNEGFGIRLENDILLTETGPIDFMADIPLEAEEIEAMMR